MKMVEITETVMSLASKVDERELPLPQIQR